MFEFYLQCTHPLVAARWLDVFGVCRLDEVIDALGVYRRPGEAHTEKMHLVGDGKIAHPHAVNRQVDQPFLVASHPPAATKQHGSAQQKEAGERESDGGDDKRQLRGEQQKECGEQVSGGRDVLENIAQQHFFGLLAHRRTFRVFFGVCCFSATATRCRCGALTVCVVVPICV